MEFCLPVQPFFRKNLTAEVAEHAEVKTTKSSGCKRKRGSIPHVIRKANIPKGLSEKDLCGLRLLFFHPLIWMRGGPVGRKIWIPKRRKEYQPQRFGRTQRGENGYPIIPVFLLLEEKTLRSLRTLRFHSFLHIGIGQTIF